MMTWLVRLWWRRRARRWFGPLSADALAAGFRTDPENGTVRSVVHVIRGVGAMERNALLDRRVTDRARVWHCGRMAVLEELERDLCAAIASAGRAERDRRKRAGGKG